MSSVWSAHSGSKHRSSTQQQRRFGSVSSMFIAASSASALAIENIGSNQARQGYAYERDELEARLQAIPGLSDDQIDAVIQLELLTRGD
mmetsp:Transcript_11896/g.24617  ORF Transcript_11896/g.24617 Transcript_11896/m.24617 type:complete len:89 (+) Transcript_11896:2446-2712(+)